jgi:hypothetical protein
MATVQNDMSGLFGESPLEIRKAQEAAGRAEDARVAQMSGSDGYNYMLAQGGRKLGAAAAGLFGGMDPEVRKAQHIEDAFGTLTQEDLNDPAGALTKVADHLSERGLNKEAINFRMKSTELAQQTAIRAEQVETRTMALEVAKNTNTAAQASSMLELYEQLPDSPEALERGWQSFIGTYEKTWGKAEADKVRNTPVGERKAVLESIQVKGDTAATKQKDRADAARAATAIRVEQYKTSRVAERVSSQERIAAAKIASTEAIEAAKNNLKTDFKAADIVNRSISQLNKSVTAVQKALALKADELKNANDTFKSTGMSPQERTALKTTIAQEVAELELEKDNYNSQIQGLTGKLLAQGAFIGEGGSNAPPKPVTKVPEGYTAEKSLAQAKSMAALYPDQAEKIMAQYYNMFPSAAAGKTTTPAATVAAVAKTPAEQAKIDLDADFNKSVNTTTPWEDIKTGFGNIVDSRKAGINAIDKRVDELATMARSKLKDKEYMKGLSQPAKARLRTMAGDSAAKSRASRNKEKVRTL